MAHPLKKSADAGMNAKMRRMTEGYGAADPSMNKAAPVTRQKSGPRPEEAVGFGADSDMVSPRSDRPSRRSIAANPLATYATGGGVIARARGGRSKGKGKGTHVNVIVAPQTPPPSAAAPPIVPPPPIGAAPPPMPPMPPKPPMGPPPGGALPMAPGAPGGMPPGLMPPRAAGGRLPTQKHHMTAGAVSGEGRLEKIGKKPQMGKPQTV